MTPTAAALIAYVRAADASHRAAQARNTLPAGSTRAKVTTANARWSAQAEERDRLGLALPLEFTMAVEAALWRTP